MLPTSTVVLSRSGAELPRAAMSVPRAARFTRAAFSAAVLKGCGAVALPLLLSACSWSWFGLNSSAHRPHPHSGGSLSVAPARDFAYLPAHSGHVSPNRIENTAMTVIVLKTDVAETVRNDVAHSLQVAGFRLDDDRRVLSGSIERFTVDDARSPASWTLKMHYELTDAATRKVLFSTTKTVRQKSPKFTNTAIAIDDTVKLSVDALIDDPGFLKALN